jgi:Zn finger protein HypA/HybF involved in hydrogenase expression
MHELAANRLVCVRCDNWRTQLISGDELVLQRISMNTNPQGDERNV